MDVAYVVMIAALCFVAGCIVEYYLNVSDLHSANTKADSYKHKYDSLKELQDTQFKEFQEELEQTQEDYNTLFNASEDKIQELNEEIDLLKEKLEGYESQDKLQMLQQIADMAAEIYTELAEKEENEL